MEVGRGEGVGVLYVSGPDIQSHVDLGVPTSP